MQVGALCSYYLDGWRLGTVREIPIKGLRKGMVRIQNFASGALSWVQSVCVNDPGDTLYRGPRGAELLAISEARADAKAAEQAKANRQKEKSRRFNR
jgi:hypothetical protein